MPKRKNVIVSDEELDEDDELVSKNAAEKRKCTATRKQLQMNQDKETKQAQENSKLKNKLLRLEKLLAAAQAAGALRARDTGDSEDGVDSDRLPPESEEEDDDETLGLNPSIRKGPIIPAKTQHTPRIRRREGDPRDQPAPAPQPEVATTSLVSPPLPVTPPQLVTSTVQLPTATTVQAATAAQPTSTPTATTPAVTSASSSNTTAGFTAGANAPLTMEGVVEPPSVLVPAPFASGVVPAANSRPKASDYVDDVKSLLLRAIEFYSCAIYTVNAFPNDTKQEQFVITAWKEACQEREEHVPYDLSERMKRLIGLRKSNARGDTSDLLRSHTASAYKFRDGVSKATERHNKNLYQELVRDGTYHHKEINAVTGKLTGFVQHAFISKAIRLAFFGQSGSGIAFTFHAAFNPIRTETVALIVTVIRFHLEEWKDGKHIKAQFKETDYGHVYTGLVKDIQDWAQSNETAWTNIRTKWYKRAYRTGGGIITDETEVRVPQAVLDDAQAELAARTGLTDSEDEDE